MYILLRANLVINICSAVAWCRPYPRLIFYNILLPMFSAGRSPASLLLVCVPPRPTDCLVASSVGGSLSFLVPSASLCFCPGHQVRLLFLSIQSLLSLDYPSPAPPSLFLTGYFDAQVSVFPVPFSRSATSFSDRLF